MRPPNLITDHSREETALREAGVTSVSARLSMFLTAAFLLSICCVAVPCLLDGSSLHPLFVTSKSVPADFLAAPATDVGLPAPWSMSGVLTRLVATNATLKQRLKTFEQSLGEVSPLTRRMLPWLQAFSCRFLGRGNEKVYIGREGWLFYRPDVDHLLGDGFLKRRPGGEERASDPMPALIRFKEDLAARGIGLLVIPVPSKAAIAPFFLSSKFLSTEAPLENPSYPVFLRQLASHGIDVLDLCIPLSRMTTGDAAPCYLKTDTHWTPDGMEHAADLAARRIRETTGHSSGDQVAFQPARPVEVTNRGDLAAMLKLPENAPIYPRESVTIRPVIGPDGKPWKPAPSSGVLVLGDSFARIYSGADLGWGTSAGFAEQLSRFLQRPVDLLAINAGGASATRQALARSPERLRGVKTVVYEFAMRELTSGDWRIIPIPHESSAKPASSHGPAVIEGTIVGLTAPPASSPYRDVITSLHLKDVRGAGKGEVLVFVYGVRNRLQTGASLLHPGDRVFLRVVPWETKEAELGSIQRIEPAGPAADLEEIYWSDDYSTSPEQGRTPGAGGVISSRIVCF